MTGSGVAPARTAPLIVYIGGGTGTGKSTLALALAARLGLHRVLPTDTVREILRAVVPASTDPSLHRSSFERDEPAPAGETPGDDLVAAFDRQSRSVMRGVRAAVRRAVAEGVGVIVEGVHLCPPAVPLDGLSGAARQVLLVLSTRDQAVHRRRFRTRSDVTSRGAERYLAHFDAIRLIHDRLIERAAARGVPVVDTSGERPPIDALVRIAGGGC